MTTKLHKFWKVLKPYNFPSFRMTSNRQPVDLTGDDEGERERPRKRARTAGSTLRDSISPPRPRNNPSPSTSSKKSNESHVTPPGSIISSPFQLTSIRDLPGALNKDAVSLQSLICDPMIAEMWEFNYMHDLDFLMSNLDPDTRDTVRINVVHGYWKKDSGLGMKVRHFLFLRHMIVTLQIFEF
jgi:tyrosyl-DNA phosphodiesterase-1